MRRLLAGIALVIGVAGCGGGSGSSGPPPLQAAKDSCVITDTSGARVGDNGTTLIVHTTENGEAGPTALGTDELRCILDAVHTPDYVREKMSNTRALDGTQNADWERFNASWTYHPDNGFNLILHQK